MPKQRLLWRFLPSYILLAALVLLIAGFVAVRQLERLYLADARSDLTALADVLDNQLGPEFDADRQEFARLCHSIGDARRMRITLFSPTGEVDFDSRNRPEEFEDPRVRPELDAALSNRAQDAVRYNAALGHRVMFVAVPLLRHDRQFGVIYLSQPLEALDTAAATLKTRLVLAGLVFCGLAFLWAWWASKLVAEPLARLRQTIDRAAGGDWQARVSPADSRELAEVMEAFNRMAAHLQSLIGVLVRNNNEQKAVLASMTEGVLAVDDQERIISLNRASGQLLGLDQTQAQGRPLQEIVRHAGLNRFIGRALANPAPLEDEVMLHGNRLRVLQAHSSALRDLQGRPIGAVVVLNDVTDFRKLEQIRRDFVANVSHELKTPITSIKGFVETLLDGAVNDPEAAERFLRIVAKQADRLHAIIEDLLSLSKIEQGEEAESISLEPAPLRPVLEAAIASSQPAAAERNIAIVLECEPQWQANLNSVLLEQAVVNLLDNAIKYSEPQREVRVKAASINGEVTIAVIDRGSGIAEEHLDRIFERFYRVDPARSRKLGGTGLGLAIVKHIVQAHRGRISVQSTPGAGSTFTIHLPKM